MSDDRPILLSVRRAGRPEHSNHDEEVLVDVGDESVVLHMEDGERIVFDRRELDAALREAA